MDADLLYDDDVACDAAILSGEERLFRDGRVLLANTMASLCRRLRPGADIASDKAAS